MNVPFLRDLWTFVSEQPVSVSIMALALLAANALIRTMYRENLDAINDGPQKDKNNNPASALLDRQEELKLRGFPRYLDNVRKLLDAFTVFIGDSQKPSDSGAARPLPFHGWSAQSFLFALGFATLYPLLLLLLTWLATSGKGATLGSLVMMSDRVAGAPDTWLGIVGFVVVSVVTVATLLWFSFPVSRREINRQVLFAALSGFTLYALMSSQPLLAIAPALAAATLAKGPLAGTMLWFCANFTVALVFLGPINPLFAWLPPAAAVLTFRAARFADRSGALRLPMVGALVLTFAGWAWLLAKFASSPVDVHALELPLSIPPIAAVAVLSILPFANAVADWMSLSITRSLMMVAAKIPFVDPAATTAERSQNALSPTIAFCLFACDVVLALFLTLFVTFAAVVSIEAFNHLLVAVGSSYKPIDVDAIINSIAANPTASEHIWVYVMLYSTLLPTLFHVVVGTYSLVHLVPVTDFKKLAQRLEDDRYHTDKRRQMARELTLVHIADDLLVAAILVAIGYGLFRFVTLWAWLGGWVLATARSAAQVI